MNILDREANGSDGLEGIQLQVVLALAWDRIY